MILRAACLLRPDEPPLQQAELHVDAHGRVAWAGPRSAGRDGADGASEPIDFGPGSIIIPGLINAHTHLELSHLSQPLQAGASFTDWVTQVIELNRRTSAEDRARGVALGVQQSLAAGVTCVGDITHSGDGWDQLLASPLRSTRFIEIFGHRPREIQQRIKDDLAVIAAHSFPARADHRPGLSPHAPYSAGPRAFMAARQTAQQAGLPLATHLHETEDEIRLYQSGSGPMRRWPPIRAGLTLARFKPSGQSPIATLAAAGFFDAPHLPSPVPPPPPVLIAHANYLDDADIDILRRSGASVAYCPRSHAHFNHPPHPVERLLASGVNVALGTDSLASSPSLSVLDEMRFLHTVRSTISPAAILKMATSAAAVALGRSGLIGRLIPGEAADMTVLKAAGDIADPYAALLDQRTRVESVFIAGTRVFRQDDA